MRIHRVGDATMPSYATPGSAGLDLCAIQETSLAPMERKLVPTGISLEIPPGYEGQIRPRSGLALRHGLTMVNSPGTIDSDYRGEVGLIMINLGSETVKLGKGDRVAQLVICKVSRATLEDSTGALSETDRGRGGFGSTGT